MSDQPGAGGAFLDDVFASVMGTLVPDEAAAPGGAPAPAEGAPAGASNPPEGGAAGAPGDAGAPAPAGTPAAPGADGGAGDAAGTAAPADAGGDRGAALPADAGSPAGDPAAAGVDYDVVAADLGGLSQKFEETSSQAFQSSALTAVQTEYKPYFDMLRQHPRMLVGTEVPSLNGPEGSMETLRSSEDAREYQEAVKVLLTEEVRERTTAALEENKGILDTVHQSIELFTKNKDLVPGTKQFDRALADRFAAMAKPYELRVDGKLHGFTIPVQPLIDSLRASLAAERATARPAAANPAAAAGGAPGTPAAPAADPPQAGIGSKAGASSDDADDFSVLFGTLGLPNLRI